MNDFRNLRMNLAHSGLIVNGEEVIEHALFGQPKKKDYNDPSNMTFTKFNDNDKVTRKNALIQKFDSQIGPLEAERAQHEAKARELKAKIDKLKKDKADQLKNFDGLWNRARAASTKPGY